MPRIPAGSWWAVAIIYLYGVLGSASLSKVIPLQADFQSQLGATPAQFGLMLSLMAVPSALLATLGGTLADRIGARTTLMGAALLGVIANLLYTVAPDLQTFLALRLLEGCILVGAYSAAPALIMATMRDADRGRAMAVWSTYTPVGVSTGLLLSGAFAGTLLWRSGYGVHAAAFALLFLISLFLPQPPRSLAAPRAGRGLLAAYTDKGPLRVALAFGMLVVMGFGVTAIFPVWHARAHGVPAGDAARLLSLVNLAMIPGGALTALLLGRGWAPATLLRSTAALSLLGCSLVLVPGGSATSVTAGLGVWMLTSGAAMALVTSTLPRVIRDPSRGAAAAGLMSQMGALCTVLTPQIWLPLQAHGLWWGCLLVVGLTWLATLALLPSRAP
ncbi:MAG: hypothetical protein RL026_2493 [Pseudomonadota bacterium]|jgi:predicted MFS family arabinose efflux permease